MNEDMSDIQAVSRVSGRIIDELGKVIVGQREIVGGLVASLFANGHCLLILILGAKAFALMDGRAAPEAADVRRVAAQVLAHRIVPNYRATGEGLKARDLVDALVKEVKEPGY